MNTLVICKIADPELRKKLHRKLKERGLHHGQGIFECDFNSMEQERLLKFLAALRFEATDFVIVYRLCHTCQQKRETFGNCKRAESDDFVII